MRGQHRDTPDGLRFTGIHSRPTHPTDSLFSFHPAEFKHKRSFQKEKCNCLLFGLNNDRKGAVKGAVEERPIVKPGVVEGAPSHMEALNVAGLSLL